MESQSSQSSQQRKRKQGDEPIPEVVPEPVQADETPSKKQKPAPVPLAAAPSVSTHLGQMKLESQPDSQEMAVDRKSVAKASAKRR